MTILIYFKFGMIKMSLDFFVITATTTQKLMQIIRKIKKCKQFFNAYIYRLASEKRFYLVFISDIIYIRSH